jgi:hypothetical protein
VNEKIYAKSESGWFVVVLRWKEIGRGEWDEERMSGW